MMTCYASSAVGAPMRPQQGLPREAQDILGTPLACVVEWILPVQPILKDASMTVDPLSQLILNTNLTLLINKNKDKIKKRLAMSERSCGKVQI